MRSAILVLAVLVSGCASAAPAVRGPAPHSAFPSGLIPVGDIDADTLPPIQKKFDELVAAGEKTILFRINSFGGAVFAGMDFIQHVEDAARAHGVKIQCVVDSRAMSMGAVFLETFCEERLMTRRSMLMFHGAATQARGKQDDIESAASEMRAMNDAIANACSARMSITADEYKAHVAHQDWFMAADEALRLGAVDGFVSPTELPAPYVLEAPEMDPLKKLLGG